MYRRIFSNLLLLMVIVGIVYFVFNFVIVKPSMDAIVGIFVGVMVTMYVVIIYNRISRSPTTLVFSMLGFPYAGKTVYLTVLFRELPLYKNKDIKFVPYGTQTSERVSNDLSTLAKGRWLPKTQPGSVFYYRAEVSIGEELFGIVRRRHKLEIADYAGEHFDEMVPYSSLWLHRGDYFKQVIQSDGVIIAADSEYLVNSSTGEVTTIENKMVTAINVLVESKGGTAEKRIKTPIALVFLKTDVVREGLEAISNLDENLNEKKKIYNKLIDELQEIEKTEKNGERSEEGKKLESEIQGLESEISILEDTYNELVEDDKEKLNILKDKLSNFIDVCGRRCEKFRYYFVSSVGRLSSQGEPPEILKPYGVEEPILWLLDEFK